ncbi:MAG: hypothetical protein ACI4ST_02835, partial [Candidatus Gallimonas sp.]
LVIAAVFAVLFFLAGGFAALEGDTLTQVVILAVFALLFVGGGCWLICRFFRRRKLPSVLIEADDEKLYLHGKQEREILLADLIGSSIIGTPESLFVFLFQQKYGTLSISPVANGKDVKMKFVDEVTEVPARISRLVQEYAERHGIAE